ncbi:MAG: type I methionyl aminopeptidase [Firmicutes bacterium]|nr:type I methionyl aminopeptidase [Bacillota bacterium]
MIVLKSERELEIMRKAGAITAKILHEVAEAVRPGIRTLDLDILASELATKYGAKAAFKGYHGYPASICVSVDEEVVHGIPGERVLREGQLVSLDFGVLYNGYYGDSAITVPVGEVSDEAKRLIEVTRTALEKGIEQAVVGRRLSDISHAIQTYVEANGFAVVRDYVGHGIGRQMHEAPPVPNFGLPDRGPRLKEGMTLAIEPMVNVSTWEVEVLADGWTVVTKDRSLSAHFEHTVAILDGGPEILTLME